MSLGTGYRIRGNVREVNAEDASEEEDRREQRSEGR